MKRIGIGVQVYSDPERLLATLAALEASISPDVGLLLLGDGPDAATADALSRLSHIKQSVSRDARGAAACFNRLVSQTDYEVFVFLESGSLPGQGWLDLLLSALEQSPINGLVGGLAGPSTNLSWNEQCAFPQAIGTTNEITHTAAQALARFGGEVRSLDPLYSLADFCYAVRREVVESIGAADETYGLGPCWEMDYNIRAARAGFRGMWVCGAYVYRSPYTGRRRLEESLRFEASKRRYQDKFCGARLNRLKNDYRSHCRGDACSNFAPTSLINIYQPFSEADPTTGLPSQALPSFEPGAQTTCSIGTPGHAATLQVRADVPPLVTCIMPTCNRHGFVSQAIRYFLRQDYENRELLIVDDGSQPVGDLVPEDDRIRYVLLNEKLTIGAKRNRACELARGDIIVHWDDDDWYPSWRIRVQVQALLDNGAHICGTSRLLYYRPSTDQMWEYRYSAPGAPWVGGNTLAYLKSFWEQNKFDDIQVAEDSRFVFEGPSRVVFDIGDPTLCIATVHSGNTSPKQTEGGFWQPQPASRLNELLGDDLYFYRAMFDPPGFPLVSCIMPTFNRRAFIPLATQAFLSQDYPNKEMIIVDDGDDKIGDLVDGIPGVVYVPIAGRASIGSKRNLACGIARGEIIAHWDDDDWYAQNRLRYQIMPILREEAHITGLENAFVMEVPAGRFWTTSQLLHRRMFVGNVHGGTLVFRKDLIAEGLRYPDVNLAEDAYFLQYATSRGKRLIRLPNAGVFIYVRHGRNAWRECQPGAFMDPAGWERTSPPPTFSRDLLRTYLSTYRGVCA